MSLDHEEVVDRAVVCLLAVEAHRGSDDGAQTLPRNSIQESLKAEVAYTRQP